MAIVSRPWGVTPALVASRVQSMRLSADSQPSIADAEAMIREESAWVAARLRRVGVGHDLDDDSETIDIARGVLYRLVIAQIDTLRGRADTEMSTVRSDADARIMAIDVGPQGLGDGADESKNQRVATSASMAREIDRYNDTHAGLGVRLATRGRV